MERNSTICGGIPPDEITIRRILIDGKETGIDRLGWIIGEVRKLGLKDEAAIRAMHLKRVKQFNYVPTKKYELYVEAIMREYGREDSGSGDAGV
jgi:hypothetical protein